MIPHDLKWTQSLINTEKMNFYVAVASLPTSKGSHLSSKLQDRRNEEEYKSGIVLLSFPRLLTEVWVKLHTNP